MTPFAYPPINIDPKVLELHCPLASKLKPLLTFRKFKKNEIILSEGQVCNKLYFIKKGIIKQYYLTEDGKELVQNFFIENTVACHFNSLLSQKPSGSYLEVIEDAEVMILNHHQIPNACILYPEFEERIALCISQLHTRRLNILLQTKASDRYQIMLQQEPNILLRVPHYLIASYLGMTPETMSRIRKKLMQQQHIA